MGDRAVIVGEATTVLLAAAAAISLLAYDASLPSSLPREAVVANDNRAPAGTLAGRTLHLSLDARWGVWYPDGPANPGIPMQAFGEIGKALEIPGPLIRVPTGTEVEVRLRNSIPATQMIVHGLVDRPGGQDRTLTIPFGSVRVVRFRTSAAGTYYYWATTAGIPRISRRLGWDSQLHGAIVVDPPGATAAERNDRIFVIGTWLNVFDPGNVNATRYGLETFNGRAWPYTERLSYPQGAVVRWRWIDAGAASHPLHLHGFYFRIESRGDAIRQVDYPTPADQDVEVTELIPPGGTFMMTWQADRPGTWLFHCHIPAHTVAHLPIAEMLAGKPMMSLGEYLNRYVPQADMGGMVLGITIRPAHGWRLATETPARRLKLFVETAPDNSQDAPSFRYVLDEGHGPISVPGHVGPPLVLTQGVPVAIDVINHLDESTTVHWHGIELSDGYYDGAAGISGDGYRVAPTIAPGATFEVRFTPSRSGTFVYHTHQHDVWEFRGGLAGPLIVLPPGARFDPSTDHVVMLTSDNQVARVLSDVFINGERTPPPMIVDAGIPQRFRLINMTIAGQIDVVTLESATGPVLWRPVAIDGADLPNPRRSSRPAVQALTIGKTLDFSFTPDDTGDLEFVVRSRSGGPVIGRLPLHVVRSVLSLHALHA